MLLPAGYTDPETEYWKLINDVTVWDVSVERQVEITGPDAFTFTNRLTPRDLTQCSVGQCKYVVITDENGGIINDPVLARLGENHFWLALADSDTLLWAKGVALNSGLNVQIREPDVSPIQVQGPKSKDVMQTLFGDKVLELPYYYFLETELDGIPVIVTRTGWTGEVGYEIYLRDGSQGPAELAQIFGGQLPQSKVDVREYLKIEQKNVILEGRIEETIYIGTDIRYRVALDEDVSVVVRIQNFGERYDTMFHTGDKVYVHWPAENAQILTD